MTNKVSVLEYATLSEDIYNNYKASEPRKPKISLKFAFGDWKDVTNELGIYPFINYHHSFFARLYVRKLRGQRSPNAAVIAYRGTLINYSGNLLDDLEIGVGHLPHDEPLARAFYINAVQYIYSHGLHPRFTGHSLGGALAQLVAINSRKRPPVVTFNSPGIGKLVHKSDYYYIHNYNSKDGLINKVGTTEGHVSKLDVRQGKILKEYSKWLLEDTHTLTGLAGLIDASYKLHRMKNMIKTIDKSPILANTEF